MPSLRGGQLVTVPRRLAASPSLATSPSWLAQRRNTTLNMCCALRKCQEERHSAMGGAPYL
jgi:hypothetical protein